MGIVKLKTRDIMNASQEEIDNDMEILVHFNRVYLDDYKLISLNYPTNTKTQQAYFKDKLEHTTNEVFKEILQESYDNVREAEFNNTSRNHYIMFFGDSLKHIVENEDAIIRNLGRLAQKMSISQQIQLLFSLTNKNIPVVYDDNADKVIYNDNKDEYIKKYGYNPYLMKEICPKGNITFSHENYIKPVRDTKPVYMCMVFLGLYRHIGYTPLLIITIQYRLLMFTALERKKQQTA